MNGRLGSALVAGAVIVAVLGWSLLLGSGLAWPVLAVVAVCGLAVWGLWWTLQRTGDATAAVRERLGRSDDGVFHAFGGVRLQVEDDGRHVWVDGPGMQRVLGRREPEQAQAARHAGAWRRSPRGVLMLRVDAVVQHLAHMPGRDEPRIQKLRRYLEHDVLYPAQRRREAALATRAPRSSSELPPQDPA